ncbi:MAG: MOFRL family protein, partial [Promethearchaeota archaeon]
VYDCCNATLICLIISDVIGNKLDTIASGPTVADSTTYQDAYNILTKYKLGEKAPYSIKETIEKGLNSLIPENPKEGDAYFRKVHNYLIGSVEVAVQKISKHLNKLGFICEYFSNQIDGEARDYAKKLYEIISNEVITLSKKKALIGTGELTVTLKGNGIGGRNQEMLLNYLDIIRNKDIFYNFVLIAVNFDGLEGNSKAMGALIDNHLINQINSRTIDLKQFIKNNDSNSFFKKFNSEIITGATGSNVNDLILVILSQ